jgi:enterochelin esterase-like enzyme
MKRFILMMASGLILTNASAQRWSGTRQHLTFDGPITKQEVRYSIYLPAGYEETTNRYPVLYYLHGIGGDETDSPKLIDALEPAVESGLVPPMIVVFANGQNNSMWANSKQGPKQVETNVIKELIPYVDATYRTIVDRHSRALLGFSMGGYGAATYACKYPELFSACISYDGAMLDWASLSARQRGIVDEIFSNDEEYYNQTSPWENSTKNADAIRDGVAIRMVVGKLKDRNLEFR